MKLAHVHILEHTLFKNVSNRVTFLWQTQIQTIECGLNDTKRITKNQVTLILYSSTPSDMIFKHFGAQSDFGKKKKSQKIYSLRPFLS